LRVKLVQSDRRRLGRSPTEDAEAYALYMKGRYYWNERTDKGIKKAMEYFTEATRRDPHFALGYSGLADCYTVMARNEQADPEIGMQRAEEFSRKALAIDDRLAEAHANLAGIVWTRERDVGKAEAEYKRAIELKPNYSTAHQWYSHLLAAEKRLPEAMTEIMKALELDPLSLVINVNVGDGLYYLKEYDRAIEQFSKVIEMDPSFEVVYPSLIQVYVRKSMFDDAFHQVEKYGRLANKPVKERLLKASVYAAMGKAEETRKLLAEVEAVHKQEHISAYNIALVYFLLADNTKAFEWLEIAYRSYDSNLFNMGIDFELDNVRTDPRYLSLIDKIGLGRRARRTDDAVTSSYD
jgi:tetratricopeptide (TPR) repeat protein